MIREASFVERRAARWQRLEALLAESDRGGVRGMQAGDVGELVDAYRATAVDLATAQSRDYPAPLRAYLNNLVARAHATVYRAQSEGGAMRVWRFVARSFPREVRASAVPIGACAALLAVAAAIAYVLVTQRPLDAYTLVPGGSVPLVTRSLHDSNFAVDPQFASTLSAAIITNNIRVAIGAFAGGMTAGIVTAWLILTNGLMLGALGALFARAGFGMDFWATIAPHGVIELTAIAIAGGAGFLLAGALVAPGPLRRVDALVVNGRRAGVLVAGVALMLVVAGTIEGFFTPLRTPVSLRLAVGALSAALLFPYLAFAGRARAAGITTHPAP